MTHVRRNLTSAEARAYLKSELWEQHGEHLAQADHTTVTLCTQVLVAITETREDMDNRSDAEITQYLTTMVVGLHKNINGEK